MNEDGKWVTINGAHVFISNKDVNNYMNNKIRKNKVLKNNDRKEKYIQLIVDEINKDYEKMDKNDREWADSYTNYLDAMGYDSGKAFKEDIMHIARRKDNENYENGGKKEDDFDLHDDGDMVLEDGTIYSYRKALIEAKKRIKYFNESLFDEEEI